MFSLGSLFGSPAPARADDFMVDFDYGSYIPHDATQEHLDNEAQLKQINANNSKNTDSPDTAETEPANKLSTEEIEVYFGLGCFWHMQHEFVQAEKTILGRTDDNLTALAGYAGGTKKDGNRAGKDLVCYHNFPLNIGDYGKLGHGEVVRVKMPENKF